MLWHPNQHTMQILDLTSPRPGLLDEKLGRFLPAEGGLSGSLPNLLEQPRWFYRMAADGRELRWYNLDGNVYQVVKRWNAKVCAGNIELQSFTPDLRYLAVNCALPSTNPKKRADATHLWSEVLDRTTARVWHTDLYVEQVTQQGLALVNNRRVLDWMSYFRKSWVAVLPG